jgi:hypothetical protein
LEGVFYRRNQDGQRHSGPFGHLEIMRMFAQTGAKQRIVALFWRTMGLSSAI